jgi:hypothetical protein
MDDLWTISIEELRQRAKEADWAVKSRNIWCINMFKRIWDDPEYLELLDLADSTDSVLEERLKNEK